MKKFHRTPLTQSISLALLGSVVAVTVVLPAHAQDETSAVLEEVIVTATKREQNLQDVALSVQVLGNQQLEDLNVRSFEDFVNFLPTVSYCFYAQCRLLPGRTTGDHDQPGPGYPHVRYRPG